MTLQTFLAYLRNHGCPIRYDGDSILAGSWVVDANGAEHVEWTRFNPTRFQTFSRRAIMLWLGY